MEYPIREYFGQVFVGIRNLMTGVRSQPRFPPELWSTFDRLMAQLDLTVNAREHHHGILNVNIPHKNPRVPEYITSLIRSEDRDDISISAFKAGKKRAPTVHVKNQETVVKDA
mgnify:CR=1 FL=1